MLARPSRAAFYLFIWLCDKEFMQRNSWIRRCSLRCVSVLVLLIMSDFCFSSDHDYRRELPYTELSARVALQQKHNICKGLQEYLVLWKGGRSPEKLRKEFLIEYQPNYEGDDLYSGLDIDDDGVEDSVVRSCGASLDAVCHLVVDLSSGNRLELEEERFFLARVRSSIYVIVGETSDLETRKRSKRRIYQITKKEIKLVCPCI